MAKEFLSHHGVQYENRDLTVNPAYRGEILELTGGISGVPLFVIDSQVIRRPDRKTLALALGIQE